MRQARFGTLRLLHRTGFSALLGLRLRQARFSALLGLLPDTGFSTLRLLRLLRLRQARFSALRLLHRTGFSALLGLRLRQARFGTLRLLHRTGFSALLGLRLRQARFGTLRLLRPPAATQSAPLMATQIAPPDQW
ncbi:MULTISPECIES: hypothetical protein [unclassified Tepidimonas]|uniref:hypothetical protein n=1 Tax=unclassified Tepidimonas TaxID=2631705 RepID=UPI003C7AC455